jgi:hypothetical protein
VTLGSPQVIDELKRTLASPAVFASTGCRSWLALRRTATDGAAARASRGQTAVRVDLVNPPQRSEGQSALIALCCDQT